jgi:hypothetical protein
MELYQQAHRARRDAVFEGAPMTQEPRVNLHRLAANIVLDATLLRWFAYNGGATR